MGEDVKKIKRSLPLLDYLQQQNWIARRAKRKLQRLDKRLLAIASQLRHIATAEK
jgi:hypothetical protein